jgi:hypothetical protein
LFLALAEIPSSIRIRPVFFGDEFRLAFLLLLNGTVLAAAWIAARRWTAEPVQRLMDTLLLWFAVQYAAVCIPGVLHVLSPFSISITALLLSGAMFAWHFVGPALADGTSIQPKARPSGTIPSAKADPTSISTSVAGPRADKPPVVLEYGRAAAFGADLTNWIFLSGGLFVAAMTACVVYKQAAVPIIDSDAMTYHVPAAIHWLQAGKLDLFPVWFFNPANTFSPLAGSAFIAWWIAPLGNDSIARAVQWPAVLLLFLAALQLGRAMGLPAGVAALVAIAVTISRPFTSELMSARDDVYLAAFIAVALASCGNQALRDRFAPFRLGLAVGLAAATKYTFFFAAPVFLLALDAPAKAGWKWRQWGAAIVTALLIAGPWYARNWILAGNPLYPIDVTVLGHRVFGGLFAAQRSERLRTWAGIDRALFHGFHAQPALLWAMLAGWMAALIGLAREALRQPLVRACLFALPICLVLFFAKAPYAEVRFLFPALVPTFIAVGLGICRWVPWPAARWGIAAVLPAISIVTSYRELSIVAEFSSEAVAITLVGLALAWGDRRLGPRRLAVRSYVAAMVVLAGGMVVFVGWKAYLQQCRANPPIFWGHVYPRNAAAWSFIAENVPADATLAYTNTYLVYPLYDPSFRRRVVYVPARSDVCDFAHLPIFPSPLPGEKIEAAFAHVLHENPDADRWRKRLLDSGAQFFYADRTGPEGEAPEMDFADGDPAHFMRLFRDEGGAIYRVIR